MPHLAHDGHLLQHSTAQQGTAQQAGHSMLSTAEAGVGGQASRGQSMRAGACQAFLLPRPSRPRQPEQALNEGADALSPASPQVPLAHA